VKKGESLILENKERKIRVNNLREIYSNIFEIIKYHFFLAIMIKRDDDIIKKLNFC